MKHIIKMIHRLTDDQAGIYFSCEENGCVLFVSDLKQNGRFHLVEADSAVMSTYDVHLFRADTQERLLSFIPDINRNMYAGTFLSADNIPFGNIVPVGFGSNRYYAANIYGNQYECYKWAVGTSPCMMFYKNGVQKAMLVEDKLSVNQMYSMTMHIADDENIYILCMLGLIYHQFENVANRNSRFHQAFVRHGWSIAFCENVSDYHFEIPMKGIGKSKYNTDFLKQFYSEGFIPYQDETATVGAVMKEMGHGLREAAGETWTEKNFRESLKNPVAIVVLAGVPVLFGIIGGVMGPLMLLSMGIDVYAYSSALIFIIGFLTMFLLVGIIEGIFLLFLKWLVSKFGKKK